MLLSISGFKKNQVLLAKKYNTMNKDNKGSFILHKLQSLYLYLWCS